MLSLENFRESLGEDLRWLCHDCKILQRMIPEFKKLVEVKSVEVYRLNSREEGPVFKWNEVSNRILMEAITEVVYHKLPKESRGKVSCYVSNIVWTRIKMPTYRSVEMMIVSIAKESNREKSSEHGWG